MILTRLSATNFMRFRELELTALPAAGLIGVLGENESGKSTLGHAICFALFGGTARPGPEHLASLIRWGADFAEVELSFEIPGRGSFRVFREIDRLGEHLAQLEDLDTGRTVSGVYPVARELNQLLGYSFADFRASVYMAQGELERPQGRDTLAASIERLSGVALFRRAVSLSAKRTGEIARVRAEVEHTLAREREQGGDAMRGRTVEASHLASLADREAELAALQEKLSAHEARVGRVRDMRAHHEELARGLDRLAALGAARSAAGEIGPLSLRLGAALAALPGARAGVAARVMTARGEQERSDSFHELLARFGDRVGARGADLQRMLDAGRTGSVADERLCAVAETAHLMTSGRWTLALAALLLVLGVLGAILTGVELPSFHRSPLVRGAAAHLPDYVPFIDGFLAIAGFLLVPLGLWQRRQGRRSAAQRQREIRDIDRRIDLLESERQLLAQRTPLDLLKEREFVAIEDPGLREMAARIASEHAADIRMAAGGATAGGATAGGAVGARAAAGAMTGAATGAPGRDGAVAPERAAVTADIEIGQEEAHFRALGSLAARLQHALQNLAHYDDILRRLDVVAPAAADLAAIAPDAPAPATIAGAPSASGTAVEDGARLLEETALFAGRLESALARLGWEPGEGDVPAVASRIAAEVLGEESLGEAPLGLGERVAALERLGGVMAADPTLRAGLAELRTSAAALDQAGGGSADRLASEQFTAAVAGMAAALPAAEQLATLVHAAVSERDAIAEQVALLAAQIESERGDFASRAPEFAAHHRAAAESDTLAAQRDELDADLAREKLAAQLLDSAAQQLSARVVPHLARAIGRALDRITGGRYSRVEVGAGAHVRVYSDEKNAFVDPGELSTGTQGQIHLAERLGFAEVLLLAKGLRGGHFLFLDEPLGGFDRARTTGFIELLREFIPVFPQIFFLAGDTELAPVFDCVVRVGGAARDIRIEQRSEVGMPALAFEAESTPKLSA